MTLHIAFSLPQRGVNIDVEVPLTGVTAVIGPNGAGKSTTFDVIAGLLPVRGATVRVGQRDFNSPAVPAHKRRIGYVMQDPRLFPHMSVEANVAFGLPRGEKARAVEELKRFHVEHLRDRMPNTLSGGQAARVALARALAPRPELLLLDEPFVALDAPARAELRAHLHTLSTPILLITHDRADTEIADHVVVLEDGHVVQVGTRAEVAAQPRGLATELVG